MNGIRRFLSFFCDVCSAVSRLISWALCFPVFTSQRVEMATFFEELAHFPGFVGEIGVFITEAFESER